MTETPVSTVSTDSAEAGEVPAPVDNKPVRRGRIAAVAGSALLAAALVAGVGHTVVTVRNADRDPGKPTWGQPKAAKEEEAQGGPKAGSLSALFVPFNTTGYERGPDIGEHGADVEFDEQQADAVRKEPLQDLPRSTRKALEKEVDKQRVKGMAMRSYMLVDGYRYDEQAHFAAEVTLTRMANRDAVRKISTAFNSFFAATDVFRKGPKVKGHKEARCFLTPKADEKQDLDGLFCSAYVGDVLVSVSASGPSPLDTKSMATFLAAQLDRIDDPGQAV
ncbi:hypothetical protein ACQEV2_19680 [Streptomyces sp. CA-251387]|uniref:hypothetical protein n=1 Tax=Streptomyces sp. CA-251387 TaxID=3240064 RepID=UPI003D93D085